MWTIVVRDKTAGTEQSYEFDKNEVTLGRVEGNDIVLASASVSRRHARIVEHDGRFFAVDLKGTNGTYVNGRRITTPVAINNDSKVVIASFDLRIITGAASAVAAPTAAATTTVTATPTIAPTPLSSASTTDALVRWRVRWSDSQGAHEFVSESRRASVGGATSSDVYLADSAIAVSAHLEQREGFLFVCPTPSARDVYVRGRPVLVPTLFNVGDELKVGSVVIVRHALV